MRWFNNDSIWFLIKDIISQIYNIQNEDDSRIYIFVFDQYNDKVDKSQTLIDIYEEFINNKKKK